MDRSSDIEATSDTGLLHNKIGTNGNFDDFNDEIGSDDSQDGFREEETDGHDQDEDHDGTFEEEYVGPVLPGGHRFDRKLICIKYPGNVINEEKAIETLGGLAAISTAVDRNNRRLELRFRPDDGYCKPACGDRHATCGFLLRIRVKKSRSDAEAAKTASQVRECVTMPGMPSSMVELQNPDLSQKINNLNIKQEVLETQRSRLNESGNSDDGSRSDEIDLKVLGRFDTEFKFSNLCDFQYLPIATSKDNRQANECIYQQIYPTGIPSFEWLNSPVHIFLPPAAFSRMDTVQQFAPKTETSSIGTNLIGKTRKRRAGLSNIFYFNSKNVPSKPPKGIETAMKVKFLHSNHVEEIRKLFEERPIWSKNAIMFHTKYSADQLKILLPTAAYYCTNGPWRVMWVRLGFDPRTDPSMKKYQTLDYRLKAMHGLQSSVKCKRNYALYSLPYKSSPTARPKTSVLMAHSNQSNTIKKNKKHTNENVYIYREGFVPPSRQMFYQYCDVHVKEIQEMLTKLPDTLPETKCHEKYGWLPVGFDDRCREIINKQVRAVLKRIANIPEDYPTTLPKRRGARKIKKSKSSTIKQTKRAETQESVQESDEWEDVPLPSTSRDTTKPTLVRKSVKRL